MGTERIAAEEQALRSLLDLVAQAEKTRLLFERAGMALPEPLKRLLGVTDVRSSPIVTVNVPAPPEPPRPNEAQPGWIWIQTKDASPTSLVLSILRESRTPIRATDVVTRVQAILPDTPAGSVFNIGNRLSPKVIARSEEGWALLSPENAPIEKAGYLWGAPASFGKTELAAHRRSGILHILKGNRGGLQTGQIVDQLLHACPWMQAPVNKDLAKADTEVLKAAGLIRQRGNSRKWVLTEEANSA